MHRSTLRNRQARISVEETSINSVDIPRHPHVKLPPLTQPFVGRPGIAHGLLVLTSNQSVDNMILARILHCITLLVMATLSVESTLIRSLLRNNVAGPELNFQSVDWPFDPDEGVRRSAEYQRVNGRLGERAIELVGLGEDGKIEERRKLQQYRDSIGALTYKVPGLDS